MTYRPIAGQVYVYAMITLGVVVMASALSSLDLSRPGLFAALLVLSVMSSALKVDMPLGAGSSCISLSFAGDFTALHPFPAGAGVGLFHAGENTVEFLVDNGDTGGENPVGLRVEVTGTGERR